MADNPGKQKILIVDDEEGIRSQIYWALADQYEVFQAGSSDAALEIIRERMPDLATLDIALSSVGEDTHGLDLLVSALEINPKMKVIMVTGNEDKQTALESISAGAHDYFQKPVNLDELKVIIRRALYVKQLESENQSLQSRLAQKKVYEDIIGESPKMADVFRKIETIAASDYTVLISGESGTGKELVAKAIHSRSPRHGMPFITINCGAIPEMLLESELFGHEKGAFTDAVTQKIGKFESAEAGTLFLDEIGELSLALQVKLLRFLQERTIERVGGNKPIKLDVRVLAATNRDLSEEVSKKAFREDLYYRLSVINVVLPPLRERGDDVILLANHFLDRFSLESDRAGCSFDPKSVARMKGHDWPGNVRELENRIKRAVILSDDCKIKPPSMGFDPEKAGKTKSLDDFRRESETEHIRTALARHNGNVSRAASDLGVSRTRLYDLLEKYGIERD
ncbi:MAG: PEP-CTERM-box response regulator transcription factor [candidate division Zixibacteria bacterium]|nr:PEP-CTERM-box response regulator transcription factor [candidate division Zixibacteria bacterium]MBU1469709.1 PEP-CTERM-box response regulator transcription factor [candidate division Zixibacteria bacterium]MBU2626099.1 PEP-CTERM-box response regulator transcription factor [candidate division Zixibacteria bacterium]